MQWVNGQSVTVTRTRNGVSRKLAGVYHAPGVYGERGVWHTVVVAADAEGGEPRTIQVREGSISAG